VDVLNSDGAGFARHLLDYLAGMEYLRGQDQASREAFSVLAPPRGEVPLLSGTDLSKPMVVGVAEDAVVAFGMAAALRGVADPAVELQRLFAEVIGENYPGKRIVDKWCGVDCSRHIDVREEQLNVGIRLEQFERLVTVHRLDHPETGIFKHANRREANQRFIFNNENHGMMGSHDLATTTASLRSFNML
jgi:hypothetical protein